MLDKNFSGNIGQIAAGLDYHDQSHFLKDFKSVTWQPPTAFLRSQGLPFDRVGDYLGQWDYSDDSATKGLLGHCYRERQRGGANKF